MDMERLMLLANVSVNRIGKGPLVTAILNARMMQFVPTTNVSVKLDSQVQCVTRLLMRESMKLLSVSIYVLAKASVIKENAFAPKGISD